MQVKIDNNSWVEAMGILTANLKHFYQRRAIWFLYLILAAVFPAVFNSGSGWGFAGYLIVSLLVGLLGGVLARDILNKAFAYCLPGHNEVPRHLLLVVGTAVNSVMAVIWLWYPGVSLAYSLLLVLAAAAAGMIAHWSGVLLSMRFSNALAFLGLVPVLMIVNEQLGGGRLLEIAIAEQPIGVMAAGAAVSFYMWAWLGRAGLARKYCGKWYPSGFDVWNIKKARRYNRAKMLEKINERRGPFLDKLEGFFGGKMQSYDYGATGRYVWGNIYAIIGPVLTMRFSALVAMLVMSAALLGYLNPTGSTMESFPFSMLPVFLAMHVDLVGSRTMLLDTAQL